jgi:hypothetical protein
MSASTTTKTQNPSIDVLAVYSVPFMDDELLGQLRRMYFPTNAYVDPPSSVLAYIERCIPLVLVDVVVANADERFTVDDFTQDMEPTASPQAAYDEGLFSADGQLLVRKQGCADHLHDGRIMFYLHYYDPFKPIRWTYGSCECPPPQLVPKSIWELMPYTPVD